LKIETAPGFHPIPVVILDVSVKPCAAYLHYVEMKTVPVQEQYTFTKFKGFITRFDTTTSVTAGVSAGIIGCNASLEMTTEFSYGEKITAQTQESWTVTTFPGTYVVFQQVLVYAYPSRAA